MSKKTLTIGTVFSGIGAPEQAVRILGGGYSYNLRIAFACDNGEIEINKSFSELKEDIANMSSRKKNKYIKEVYASTKRTNFVKQSYMANYNVVEDDWYDDIRFFDGKKYQGKIDLFVGGSPCQSFSIIGKRAGLEDARGTLFYDFARLVNEIQPKVFIYENVLGMLTHDHGNTWKVITDVLNSLGYKIYHSVLNAKDYGIPQDRKRLFVVGFKDTSIDFEFPKPIELKTKVSDYLEDEVEAKFYLGKKGFEFVTNPKYKSRARVNRDVMQTQKANQQFNWNGDFVFEPLAKVKKDKEIMKRAYVSTWNGKKGVIRQLTCRECLRLMGFNDDFKIVVPNVRMYRQVGNSIVVNVLKSIIEEILKVVKL